jgi:methionine sulfoxide reductase heme-binding subunit
VIHGPDPTHYLFWLTSRAAGVTAFALASVSVGLGLTMAGRLARGPGRAKRLRAIHEQTALGALIAIVVHGVALLGDHWMHPGVTGISVPFAMSYRPVATGIGIIAGYLAALLGLSFYARRRIGARLWRKAHRFTALVWLMAAIHAITAGTDASTPWMRAILLASAVPITGLFMARVAGARRKRRPAPAPARAHATLATETAS